MEVTPPVRPAAGPWLRGLVIAAIVATAFNDLLPILPVGELARDGFIYVFPPLLLATFLRPGAVRAPTILTVLVLALALVLVAGVAVKWDDISVAYFKGRAGFERVVTQGIAVSFGIGIVLVFYNLTLRGCLPQIARGARWAILIMGFVGIFEVAYWFSLPGLTAVHHGLAAIVHSAGDGNYALRLRTTAFEVSWAAVMLTFLFPFAISDLPTRSGRFWFYTGLVLVLVALSQSRTGLLTIGLQGMLMLGLYFLRRIDQLVRIGAVACFMAIALLVTPGIGERLSEPLGNLIRHGNVDGPEYVSIDENMSNVTRFAAIRAGWSMFLENPVFGVGLGQFGFAYVDHILAEDYRSWEVRAYAASGEDLWPPSYSLHMRLLAETGILGYGIWLALVIPLFIRALFRAGYSGREARTQTAVATTILGWLLLGVSIDSFRFFGGWIVLGVAFALQSAGGKPAPARGDAPAAGPLEDRGLRRA